MAGCTNESELAGGSDYISRVSITAKDFEAGDAATRTAFEVSASGLAFKWAATDVVGIYPNEGDQVSFPMTAGAGTNSASFDGGGWALKGNYTYAAYFPYNVDNTTKGRSYTSLPICFTGQKQTVNNSTADMGDYDYMVATASTPASGNVNFNFDHVGSVLYVQLVSPVAETFTRLTLSTEDALWTTDATVNIATGELTPTNIAKEISVNLSSISVAANGTLYVWLMAAPANMAGMTITASAEGNTGTYTAEIAGKTLLAGKAYQLKGTLQKPGTGGTGSDIGWGDDEGDVDASLLVGTWRRDWDDGIGNTTLVINEDGTACQKESDGDGDTFTWDFNEELHQYILMDDGGEYYYVVLSCTETTLVLRDPEHYEETGDETYKRVQEGSDPTIYTVNGVSFQMVSIVGGTFQMGSTTGDDDEKPVHEVRVGSFAIGQTEVTQELWGTVMGTNPSNFKGNKRPVERVSWNDCQTFIAKLNQLTGKTFRLPTEAEWEYAARGGIQSKGYTYSGSNSIEEVAWYTSNSGSTTHEVATKAPNELGLYDMSGNVWEWCQDWYGSDYYSSSVVNSPTGPSSGSSRVYRGGSWRNNATYCRVAYRGHNSPTVSYNYLGLRLAL